MQLLNFDIGHGDLSMMASSNLHNSGSEVSLGRDARLEPKDSLIEWVAKYHRFNKLRYFRDLAPLVPNMLYSS
jgi:hypothetical protein